MFVCGFGNKLAIIYISTKVPYGCGTLPLLFAIEVFNHPTPLSTCLLRE